VLPNSAYLLPLAIVSCVFVCARSHLLWGTYPFSFPCS
jgi:hypothetical protein